jgi:hypothetical protein
MEYAIENADLMDEDVVRAIFGTINSVNTHTRQQNQRRHELDVAEILQNDPLGREVLAEYAAAAEELPDAQAAAARAVSRGWTRRTFDRMRERVRNEMGDGQNARNVIKKIILEKIVPPVAAAAGTYASSQLFPVSREGKGDIVEVTGDGKIEAPHEDTTIDEAIARAKNETASVQPSFPIYSGVVRTGMPSNRAIAKVFGNYPDGTPRNDLGTHDINGEPIVRPLPSSAVYTSTPGFPLGSIDRVLPKSSPLIPTLPPPTSRDRNPFELLFGIPLGSDLGEKASDPSANVKKTSIPLPPIQNSIPPAESYTGKDRQTRQPPESFVDPVPGYRAKRKALDYPTHDDRSLERDVAVSFDSTNMPAIPSSVSPSTSVDAAEFGAPFKGFNTPLDSAFNIVGLYDAESMEREMAVADQDNTSAESKVPMPSAQTNYPGKEQTVPEPNAANATNPAYRNQTPQPQPQLPPSSGIKPTGSINPHTA